MILVAARESQNLHTDAISITQLSTIPLIVSKEGSATRDVVFEYLRKLKVTPMIARECGSADLIKELVSHDNGVSFLVKSAVQGELKNNKLRPIKILDGSPTMEYGIGYLKRTSLSPGAWAFLRHLDKLDNILPIAQ